MKKIALYLLVVSLGWFPIQVSYASSSFAFIQDASSLSSVSNQISNTQKNTHCHTQEKAVAMTCCDGATSCSQMEHDCTNSINFVAMTQEFSSNVLISNNTLQRSFTHRLVSSLAQLEYRPPRFI